MRTLSQIGSEVALRRRAAGRRQGEVATDAGVSQQLLSRLENGKLSELGTKKLLAILAVLGLELDIRSVGQAGTLDELRRERSR